MFLTGLYDIHRIRLLSAMTYKPSCHIGTIAHQNIYLAHSVIVTIHAIIPTIYFHENINGALCDFAIHSHQIT